MKELLKNVDNKNESITKFQNDILSMALSYQPGENMKEVDLLDDKIEKL